MQLPFLKKKNESKPQREYFFALEIGLSAVKTAIWSVANHKPQIVALGSITSWDGDETESLIGGIDKSLSQASNRLDESGNIQIEKVVLGLPPLWVSEDKILPERLKLLKQVSDRLALKPIGFVVTIEAIAKQLQQLEGAPPTVILLGLWQHDIEVSLVRMGRLETIQTVKRSEAVGDDVVEGLSRFANIDILPSRMLLYDEGMTRLDAVKQLLLTYPWQAPQKRLAFLHYPKIEILPDDFSVKAVAVAGGLEVVKTMEPFAPATVDQGVIVTNPAELGFTAEKESPPMAVEIPQTMPEPEPEPEPKLELPFPKRPPHFAWGKWAVVSAVVLVIMAVVGLAYWYVPTAEVTLYLSARTLQPQLEIPIAAQTLEAVVTDEGAAAVTGEKTVGELATGGVTIYNSTDSVRRFSSGTALTSTSGGLKFILDEDVAVASASGSAANLQLGKATAKIKASQVGADYNLSAGSEFRIGSLATIDVVAKNDVALSGGSSRLAKAVSKDDLSALRTQVTASAQKQARDQLTSKIAASQMIVPESITLQTTQEEFDHKIGEVAEKVKLAMTVKAKGLVVEQADLEGLVDQQLQSQVPQGFVLQEKKNQTVTVKKIDKAGAVLVIQPTVLILPQIDAKQVAKQIAGKLPDRARDYLSSLPTISQIDIEIKPPLPAFLLTLPRVVERIHIQTKAVE